MADDSTQYQQNRLDSVITSLEFISATASFIAVILPLISRLFPAEDSEEE
ncbi:hypothetical protein JCM15765_04900 [Paradesulfitobacterium aromaticivorans]